MNRPLVAAVVLAGAVVFSLGFAVGFMAGIDTVS